MLSALSLLILAHFVADILIKKGAPYEKDAPRWFTSIVYSYIHAMLVYFILGLWWIAILEFAIHYAIADARHKNQISFLGAQAFHIGTKVLWLVLAIFVV